MPIETKVREFHGKLLFSLAATEKGFDVILGGQQELHERIDQFGKGIFIDKSIADTKRTWFKRSRSLGNAMCTWDEEGLVVFSEEIYIRLRICEELFEQIKLFFAWGDADANAILSNIPESKKKVRVTGNPRFDLLRPEFRPFHKKAVEKLHKRFGRILLVNTNFAFANFFLGDEKVQEVYRAYRISEEPGFFEGWAKVQSMSYKKFLEIIPILSKRYPKHTIVIRPHPSELFDPWDIMAKDLDNVVVNGEGNVHEWILSSDALVHFNCTTGVEAFFLDVPAISYRTPGNEEFHQPLPNDLSLKCFDAEQLLSTLDEIIMNGDHFPRLASDSKRTAIAHKHIASINGPLASDCISECLKEVGPDDLQPIIHAKPSVPLPKKIWRKVLNLVRRPDPGDIAYSKQKFPGLELEEIKECIARFQNITGRFEGIRIHDAGKNCFRFTAIN